MPRLFLVDGSYQAFRLHFAMPPRHTSSGFPTRVLYGFTNLFNKMLRTWQPDYVVVSFDIGASFRKDIYPEYKGHRPEMPKRRPHRHVQRQRRYSTARCSSNVRMQPCWETSES